MSSRAPTNALESLRKKENKFAIAPSRIPVLDIISGVELGLSQVNVANKCLIDSARSKVVEILMRAKSPKPNLSKAEKRAMEELKQYDDFFLKMQSVLLKSVYIVSFGSCTKMTRFPPICMVK